MVTLCLRLLILGLRVLNIWLAWFDLFIVPVACGWVTDVLIVGFAGLMLLVLLVIWWFLFYCDYSRCFCFVTLVLLVVLLGLVGCLCYCCAFRLLYMLPLF